MLTGCLYTSVYSHTDWQRHTHTPLEVTLSSSLPSEYSKPQQVTPLLLYLLSSYSLSSTISSAPLSLLFLSLPLSFIFSTHPIPEYYIFSFLLSSTSSIYFISPYPIFSPHCLLFPLPPPLFSTFLLSSLLLVRPKANRLGPRQRWSLFCSSLLCSLPDSIPLSWRSSSLNRRLCWGRVWDTEGERERERQS